MHCLQHPRFGEVLKKLRLQKRGTGGVDTAAKGSTYDISNIDRLGKSEVGWPYCSVCVCVCEPCSACLPAGGAGADGGGWSESRHRDGEGSGEWEVHRQPHPQVDRTQLCLLHTCSRNTVHGLSSNAIYYMRFLTQ